MSAEVKFWGLARWVAIALWIAALVAYGLGKAGPLVPTQFAVLALVAWCGYLQARINELGKR